MKVFVPIVLNQDLAEPPEVLHHLAPGGVACSVCGASKYAQGFYYTEEAEFFSKYARRVEQFGMWSPKHEGISPFRSCSPTAGVTVTLPNNFWLSNGTSVLQ